MVSTHCAFRADKDSPRDSARPVNGPGILSVPESGPTPSMVACAPAAAAAILVRAAPTRGTEQDGRRRSINRTLIYASSNGDRWYLCQDDETVVCVVHEPSEASGGAASRIDLSAFLESGSRAPEHRALLTMIATLVEPVRSNAPPRAVSPEAGAAATNR